MKKVPGDGNKAGEMRPILFKSLPTRHPTIHTKMQYPIDL